MKTKDNNKIEISNNTNEVVEISNFFKTIDKSFYSSNKGFSKSEIYKKIAFYHILNLDTNEVLSNDMKKIAKRKIRNIKENLMFRIVQANKSKNKVDLQKAIENFKTFYTLYFVSNDYSIESICSNNTNEDNKDLFARGLKIIIENTHL